MVDTIVVIAVMCLQSSQQGLHERIEDESAAHDCSAHPQAPDVFLSEAEGADCKRKNEKAISEGENRP